MLDTSMHTEDQEVSGHHDHLDAYSGDWKLPNDRGLISLGMLLQYMAAFRFLAFMTLIAGLGAFAEGTRGQIDVPIGVYLTMLQWGASAIVAYVCGRLMVAELRTKPMLVYALVEIIGGLVVALSLYSEAGPKYQVAMWLSFSGVPLVLFGLKFFHFNKTTALARPEDGGVAGISVLMMFVGFSGLVVAAAFLFDLLSMGRGAREVGAGVLLGLVLLVGRAGLHGLNGARTFLMPRTHETSLLRQYWTFAIGLGCLALFLFWFTAASEAQGIGSFVGAMMFSGVFVLALAWPLSLGHYNKTQGRRDQEFVPSQDNGVSAFGMTLLLVCGSMLADHLAAFVMGAAVPNDNGLLSGLLPVAADLDWFALEGSGAHLWASTVVSIVGLAIGWLAIRGKAIALLAGAGWAILMLGVSLWSMIALRSKIDEFTMESFGAIMSIPGYLGIVGASLTLWVCIRQFFRLKRGFADITESLEKGFDPSKVKL